MSGVPLARQAAVDEAKRVLRSVFGVEPEDPDVLLFGTESPVASPIFLKNGVDRFHRVVYNSSKHSEITDSELFCGFRLCGGFIELELKESGWERLFELFESEHPVTGDPPADSFPLGANAACIRARLLHAANTAAEGFQMPGTALSKRALWLCMMASSPGQKSMALTAMEAALNEHRSGKTLCARVAEAMAQAVLDLF